jgi:hypothetical protein
MRRLTQKRVNNHRPHLRSQAPNTRAGDAIATGDTYRSELFALIAARTVQQRPMVDSVRDRALEARESTVGADSRFTSMFTTGSRPCATLKEADFDTGGSV